MRRFGAVGDGRTDDTAALHRAFAALPPHGVLLIPAGHVFRHADVLQITSADTTITGGGTLSASSEASSSLMLNAARITVDGLGLATPSTTRRWSAPAQHRLYLGAFTGAIIRDVVITGSAAAGIFSDGAQHFTFTNVTVTDTRADGVHLTNGSAYGLVTAPTVRRSGDDGVAVVSYESDGRPCHDISVVRPRVETTTGGRGVSVVGGTAVTYRDVTVDRSAAAAVYVACEGAPYNTFPARQVQVVGGTLTGANTEASIDHGAVLVYSGRSGGSVEDVTIGGLNIHDTRATASRQIGVVSDDGGQVGEVTFQSLRLDARPDPYEGNVDPRSLHLDDVTAAGVTVRA